jgi:hypothetical protein
VIAVLRDIEWYSIQKSRSEAIFTSYQRNPARVFERSDLLDWSSIRPLRIARQPPSLFWPVFAKIMPAPVTNAINKGNPNRAPVNTTSRQLPAVVTSIPATRQIN